MPAPLGLRICVSEVIECFLYYGTLYILNVWNCKLLIHNVLHVASYISGFPLVDDIRAEAVTKLNGMRVDFWRIFLVRPGSMDE